MAKRSNTSSNIVEINFNSQKWLTGTISLEKYDVKGVFIDLCAFYAFQGCIVTIEEVKKRFDNHPALDRLKDRFYKIEDGYIKIKYVDEEISEKLQKRIRLSLNGKLGAQKTNKKPNKKPAPNSVPATPNPPPPPADIPKITPSRPPAPVKQVTLNLKETPEERKKAFAETLKPYLPKYGKAFIREFYDYWTEDFVDGSGFRKEKEAVWEIEKRLDRWLKNQRPNKLSGTGTPTPSVNIPKRHTQSGETLAEVEARILRDMKKDGNEKESTNKSNQ